MPWFDGTSGPRTEPQHELAILAAVGVYPSLASVILGTSGLLGYWPMDDGRGATVARDASPAARNGSYGVNPMPGCPGLGDAPAMATRFGDPNQTSVGVSIPYNSAFYQTGAFTVEWCERMWGFDQPAAIFDYTFGGPQINCSTGGVGLQNIVLKKHSGSVMCTSAIGVSDTYKWHHWCVTYDGSTTVHMYLDGVDVAGATTPQTMAPGGTNPVVWAEGRFQGSLQHCAYYNRELTATEVATRMKSFNAANVIPTAPIKWGLTQGLTGQGDAGIRGNQVKRAQHLGAKVSRFDLLWSQVQTTSGGAYNWATIDSVVDALLAAGIEPFAIIQGSPTWANGGATVQTVPGVGADATFTAWVAAYQTFVAAAVNRYKDKIRWWELWNEPNEVAFWTSADTGLPDAVRYVAWYNATRATILANDPTAKCVFAGGEAEWWNTGSSVKASTFLRSCVAAGPTAIDYAAYHNYSTGDVSPDTHPASGNTFDHLVSYRDVLSGLGYPNAKVLANEIGWEDTTGSFTEATQAAYLTLGFSRIRDYWSAWCPMVLYYRDWDSGTNIKGLYHTMPSDGSPPTPKKAAAAFAAMAKG